LKSINVQYLIQFADNFFLPTYNKNKLTKEFIKNIECNVKKFPIATYSNIRN